MPNCKPAPNVPVRYKVKYVDVTDGEYGRDLRFNGTADGVERSYLYAPFDDAAAQLVQLGALETVPDLPEVLSNNKHALRLTQKDFLVTKVQGAGEKHGRLVFARADGRSRSTVLVVPQSHPTAAATTDEPSPYRDAPAPSAAPSRRPLAGIYLECTDFVLDKLVKRYRGAQLTMTPADCLAATATLFIARARAEGY